jgi:cytidylate kinase
MNKKLIVTIGRQYGTGGREIGEKLAEKLGVKCYDKELLTLAAKESGLCEEILETHDEKPTSSFLYSLVMDTYSVGMPSSGFMDIPVSQKVFLAQFDTIKRLAERESCVIVGRCADYALEDYPNLTSVFIHASMQDRIARIKKRYDLKDDKAKDLILKMDKKRASYYNYYSSKKWGDARSYDLSINSGAIGIEGAVELLSKYLEMRGKDVRRIYQ